MVLETQRGQNKPECSARRGDANGTSSLKDELLMRLKGIGELKELRQFGDDD
jgi:hypothetical protein